MAPDAERARVCCALFCGIPGSGKSTLARRLEAHLQGLPAVTPARVCFDEDYQPEGFGEPGSGEYDPAAWKEGRERALSRLDRELGSAPDGTGTRKLVIADDNMHLRSMRREVYLLAREHRADLVILYLDVGLDVALERNASRPARLPDGVLSKMHSQFEPPGEGGGQSWESNKLVVLSADAGGPDVARLWGLLDSLWSGPVSDANSPAVQAARKAEGRAANHQSWAHRLDNWMRRELSSAVRSWRDEGGAAGAAISTRVRAATAARKEILANLRLQVDEARRRGAGEEGEGEAVSLAVEEAKRKFGAFLELGRKGP